MLLAAAGQILDYTKAKSHTDMCFSRMQAIAKGANIDCRNGLRSSLVHRECLLG
jgi:hypothetical protein